MGLLAQRRIPLQRYVALIVAVTLLVECRRWITPPVGSCLSRTRVGSMGGWRSPHAEKYRPALDFTGLEWIGRDQRSP